MYEAIQNSIVSALGAITDFNTVEPWQGNIEDLLKQVQMLPSAHVILSVADFDGPAIAGATIAPSETVWSIIIIFENFSSRSAGAVHGYSLIEQVMSSLTRLNTGYGWLWPRRVQLIGVESGKVAYGFHFVLENEK